MNVRRIAIFGFLVVFCLLGLAAVVAAQGGSDCAHDPNCASATGNTGSMTSPDGTEIYDFVIKAGNVDYHYGQGTTDDGCYLVIVDGNSVSWTRYGSGRNCKDISHVEMYWQDEEPTPTPTEEVTPTVEPTEEVTPTVEPTDEVTPTVEPTDEVTPTPTEEVTPTPTDEVTPTPTEEVTPTPTEEVTPTPTEEVTPTPTDEPTPEVTEPPTQPPTEPPTTPPTEVPPTPTPPVFVPGPEWCEFNVSDDLIGQPYRVYWVAGDGTTLDNVVDGIFGYVEEKGVTILFQPGHRNGTFLVTVGDPEQTLLTFSASNCRVIDTAPPPADPVSTPCPVSGCNVPLQEVLPENGAMIDVCRSTTGISNVYSDGIPFRIVYDDLTVLLPEVRVNSTGMYYTAEQLLPGYSVDWMGNEPAVIYRYVSCSLYPGFWAVNGNTLIYNPCMTASDVALWLVNTYGLSYEDALPFGLAARDSGTLDLTTVPGYTP